MPFLHMHDGEAVIYDEVCPVCQSGQSEPLETDKSDG